MLRRFASTLLSFLLIATLTAGGCISCEEYFMLRSSKSCCDPDGRCKTKSPVKQTPDRECNQIAFDHDKSIHVHIDLPVVTVLRVDLTIHPVEPSDGWRQATPIKPSPPDLQVLHSTFLI